MPQRAHRVLIPLAAFLAILPLLSHGPSCGHDFDFHLLSWLEASTQFAHFGIPHWAYTPAWNAGEPRFIFYPPLSWTLGGLLGLILPWSIVPAVFTWICLTLSGLTAHRLARVYSGPTANPTPALLAAAFLPLLFQAALASKVRILSLAIPIALLWLSNAPAAVMACYALASLTLIRRILPQVSTAPTDQPPPRLLGTPRLQPWLLRPPGKRALAPGVCSPISSPKLQLTLTTISGLLLGLALAAFYILPAAWERRYVQTGLAVTTGMRPADHYLFHRMTVGTPGFTPSDIAFHDAVVRTASLVALTLLAAIAIAFLLLWTRKWTHKNSVILSEARSAQSKDPDTASPTSIAAGFPPQIPLLALTLLIAFLLTPPSAFLWRILPQLHFLQFPWRLCALLAVILCITTAQALSCQLSSFKLKNQSLPLLAPLLLAAILVFPAWHFFHQPCDEEDNVKARVALFHSNLGTDPTDEYTPADADPDALHPDNPPYWLAPPCLEFRPPCGADENPPSNARPGPAPDHLTLTVSARETLVLNRRAYPAWHIILNGQPLGLPLFGREDGLIALNIPPGTDTIDLRFDETPDRLTGLTLSATAAALTIFIMLKRRRTPPIRPSPMHTY